MSEICKIVVLGVVAVAPMFILANELSEDEFVKSGAGLGMVAAAAVGMRLLERVITSRDKP